MVDVVTPGSGPAATGPRCVPCPLPARAWLGDALLAESTGATVVEEPGRPPLLAFPAGEVRFDLLADSGEVAACAAKGPARRWDADGGPVAWVFADPAPGSGLAPGATVFDHDLARVEVVDAGPTDDPRDISVKRFPVWGTAEHLVDLLDLRADGPGRFVTAARADPRRPVVEGSQMLGQAVVAARRCHPDRRVVSAHMVFPRAADAHEPLGISVAEVASGRTFTTLAVSVEQAGRCCAVGTFLLDVTSPDVVRHQAPAPDTVGPLDAVPYDMSVTGRDIRVVDAAYTNDPDAPVGPPVIDAWVRFAHLPDDPAIHDGLLAQFTGHMSIAAALRPHAGIGQAAAHRTLSTAINAIAIAFHAEVRADRWMLYRHLSTHAGDGMTHSECRVHDEAGVLLASFAVDAMVRGFDASAPAGRDNRTL
jgi:acyl-CoA thioesterase/uncharacterized protein (DUF427 family)